MKVSLNAVKQYIDFELPPVDELVQKIGAQLGAVEEVVDLGKKYQGIIVAKVVKVEKHPGADKLHVCQIDTGKGEPAQVVCGAPNVREGMLAAWLPPGVTVPSTAGRDPFKLEARELRGVMSDGMLASPKELGLGEDHDGILEVDKDAKPGDDFAKLYMLDDHIIDIENKMFTHRPDCFGILGVAREIAGILRTPFKSPDWYVPGPQFPPIEGEELKLTVKNELPELVPRFTAVAMGGVTVGPSPVWLQVALTKFGQKPVNNVVDLTNFYMMVTGQPLHAYDYDKVKALSGGEPTIVIRNPEKDEKIKLLNGKTIGLRSEAIMIATDKQLIGIGGVMGGTETEVDENTKNIILECANFDMYSIRRTAMEHGLFTDAVTRFTKGQSYLQCLAVSTMAVEGIQKMASGKVASELIDVAKDDVDFTKFCPDEIDIKTSFINNLLGLKLISEEIEQLLTNVEFEVRRDGDSLSVGVPFWRTDVEIVEDIVEEVGRLYGYDHLPLKLPKRDLTPALKDPLLELKSQIRARLAKAGANELLTYSFVHGNLLDKVGQDSKQAFQIANALSPDLQYYRLSLTPSLLGKIHPNIKFGYDEFALFELGKVHIIDHPLEGDDLPTQLNRVALVVAKSDKAKKDQNSRAAFYQAKKYVMYLLAGIAGITEKDVLLVRNEKILNDNSASKTTNAPYYSPRTWSIAVNFKSAPKTIIGVVGEFRPEVKRSLKLPVFSAGFELDIDLLLEWKNENKPNPYKALPRFPKVTQDITLKVPAALSYQDLFDFAWSEVQKSCPKNSSAELGPLDIFQRKEDAEHKQITFHLQIADYDRTLTDAEVNKLLDNVAVAAKAKFGAERI